MWALHTCTHASGAEVWDLRSGKTVMPLAAHGKQVGRGMIMWILNSGVWVVSVFMWGQLLSAALEVHASAHLGAKLVSLSETERGPCRRLPSTRHHPCDGQ